jgi:outer membrane protein assembly factor BamB
MFRTCCSTAFLFVALVVLGARPAAGQPPIGAEAFQPSPARPIGFRADGSGHWPGARPPTGFDGKGGKVLWQAPLPGWSNSSPLPVGDLVITLAEPQTVIACDARTGKIRWTNGTDQLAHLLEPDKAAAVRKSQRNETYFHYRLGARFDAFMGKTMATPVTDGRRVYASYGSHSVAAYRLEDGKLEWMTFLGPMSGPGSRCRFVPSPRLVDGILVVQAYVHLYGIDADSGKVRWKTMHDLGDGYNCGSPTVLQVDGTGVIVTASGDAYRLSDGLRLTRSIGATMCGSEAGGASPITDGDRTVFLFPGNNSAHQIVAIRLAVEDRQLKTRVLWRSERSGRVQAPNASPVYHDGRIYCGGRDVAVVDATTGELIQQGPEVKSAYPSYSLAGDVLITCDNNGFYSFCRIGSFPAVRFLRTDKLSYGDPADIDQAIRDGVIAYKPTRPGKGWRTGFATPAFHGDRMYVRSHGMLHCIAASGPDAADPSEAAVDRKARLAELLRVIGSDQAGRGPRTQAMRKLWQFTPKPAEAVDELLAVLNDPKTDRPIRQAAADTLGQFRAAADRTVPALAKLAVDAEADGHLRRSAIRAIAAMRSHAGAAADPLAGLLTDPDKGVRNEAMDALTLLGPAAAARATPVLARLAEMEQPPLPSREIFNLLGKLGPDNATARKIVVSHLRPDSPKKWDAVNAVGQWGPRGAEVMDQLVELMKADSLGHSRIRVITQIARLGQTSARARKEILWALHHNDRVFRAKAKNRLRQFDVQMDP